MKKKHFFIVGVLCIVSMLTGFRIQNIVDSKEKLELIRKISSLKEENRILTLKYETCIELTKTQSNK
jgi:hypothetical protein